MIRELHQIDEAITLWINSFHHPIADPFWQLMSEKSVWIPCYLIVAFFMFKRLGWKRAFIVLASVALAIAACDQFSTLLKHSVGRLRPCYDFHLIDNGLHTLEDRKGLYGFFSAHAATTFSIAASSIIGFLNDKTHTYKAYILWSLVWASLISTSRIFVGKHFFGDVLVGACIGVFFGWIIGKLASYTINRWIVAPPAPTVSHR